MSRRVLFYVTSVSVAALCASLWVYLLDTAIDSRLLIAAGCFAALGLLCDVLSYETKTKASGSIAFLPFLATVVIAPHWIAVLAAGFVLVAGQSIRKRQPVKAVFNVAQITLSVALCVLVYRALGGLSLLEHELRLVPYLAVFVTFLTVNSAVVSGVIALSEERSVSEVWRQNTRSTFVYDLLTLPFVWVFTRVYVEFGITGTAILSIPLLGARQLYKTNYQLEKVNQELLQLMVAAIEARDPYTSGHSRRVAHYAKIIARAVGLGSKDVERISIAALLHDVGKIHEEFALILRKPDRLTPEEWAVMQTHPLKSANLVENVSQLKDVVPVVRHHHENWDGTGYPDGLAGEDIPLGARIIMFADTIDAMTTDRPYRKALGEAEVRSEFLKLRGRQFDPALCDALLASPLYSHLFRAQASTPSYWLASLGKTALKAS
jgi:putative nucleotidyltransferase with HDIG domain